jgi:hypothetical protein
MQQGQAANSRVKNSDIQSDLQKWNKKRPQTLGLQLSNA